jgi:2,4-dichlorophenol 6-monooxygenase
VRRELGIGLALVRIGAPGVRDAHGEWARLREIAEDGCLLVRPDGYIAWRRAASRAPRPRRSAICRLR